MNELLLGLIALETTYLAYRSVRQSPIRKQHDKIICDTSALIDGRVVSIARSGFIASQLVVPKSVVRELQYMADKADHDKRERARYGLDVVQELQQLPHIEVVIYDDGDQTATVDEQLIILAKKLSAKLCTTDYNLNKVARTEQIMVVNVNELAHALRPMHLPGERIQVMIVAPGQNKDQGVGYLDDGSMVVVDGARSLVGKPVTVETVRVLQTEAGRMVFARMPASSSPSGPASQKRVLRSNTRKNNVGKRSHASSEDQLLRLANKT